MPESCIYFFYSYKEVKCTLHALPLDVYEGFSGFKLYMLDIGLILHNYYKLQLRILYRTFKQLRMAIVPLAIIVYVCLVVLYHSGPEGRLMIFIILVVLLNGMRPDWYFLKSQYRNKAKGIFLCDSILLSLPFVIINIVKCEFLFAFVPIGLSMLMPLMPRVQASITMPGCFLFPKGAFEFQRVFRYGVIPYIVLFVIGVIGIINKNIHLVEACTVLVCVMSAILLLQPPERSWIINFKSVRHFLKMKNIQTLVCGVEIMLPFLVLLFIGGLSIEYIIISLVAFLFLLEQSEMLRFAISCNPLMTVLVFLVLVTISYFSLGIPLVFCLSLIALGVLEFMCYNEISGIIND